ncbi:MAG TPA: phospho-N-acetylmuramoyl-pentapeptide-transferase [Clostridiales bacterium]|nr:phospho-N-acetylmuramoyl-pentapeptide-transferase [Clostridiales bacterium]
MTEYIAAFLMVFLLTAAGGPVFIPLLRQLKFGQTVRDDGPQSHLAKTGTPTMGGILFLLPILLTGGLYAFLAYPEILPVLFLTLGFGLVGFIDDYVKVVRKHKNGISPRQKMFGLVLVAVIFSSWVFWKTDLGTQIYVPFTGLELKIDLVWLFIPFITFAAISEANAVNLTDGLDGLVSGISLLIFCLLAAIALRTGQWTGAGIFSAMGAGACLGFLIYNRHPAKIFMGDCGSLALGGALAGIAVLQRDPLILLVAGLVFLLETLSVMIQVLWYKKTRRRVFRMAPLHHHFELTGWKETKVVWVFWAITALLCAVAWFSVFTPGR